MNSNSVITDADIQAYIDNQLDPVRRREVEHYIRHNPEAAALYEDYQLLDTSIKRLYATIPEQNQTEPFINKKSVNFSRHRTLFKVAASLVWLAIGGAAGWNIHATRLTLLASADGEQTHLVQPASFAHAIYATEARHPVEVPAKQEQQLINWLSRRLHTDIKAPNLSNSHYRLMGGRLLPSTNRMAAQFMYQSPKGIRITLYIRRGIWGNEETTFHYSTGKDVGVIYWIDGELGYALVGNLTKTELLKLSQEVHHQLDQINHKPSGNSH